MPMRLPRGLLLLVLFTVCAAGCAGGAADPNTLVVFAHPASGELRFLQFGAGTITDRVQVGGEPEHLVRDSDRGRIYVTDRAGDSVAVVDVLTRAVIKRVRVGREPGFAALAPDGKRLYVAVTGEGALAVVDTEALEMTARIPLGGRPLGVALSPDGSRVYVGNDADEMIYFVDPAQGRRSGRPAPVPGGGHGGMSLSSDGTMLLIGTRGKPAIATLNLSTREVRTIDLGAAVSDSRSVPDLLATGDGRFWVAAPAAGSDLLVLSAGGGEPMAVQVGPSPSGLAVAPGGRLLATSRDGETLAEVDPEKGKVTRRIRVGTGAGELVVFSKSALEGLRKK